MTCEFSYNHYFEVLDNLKETHKIIPFREYNTNLDKFILLRHDIDFSPEKALELAEKEAKQSIFSTYFILLNGKMYNPLKKEAFESINKIKDLGHEIGLHFNQNQRSVDIEEEVLKEKTILENLFDTPVTAFSYHDPYLGYKNIDIPALKNTYSEKFTKNIKYISDSVQSWEDDVCFCQKISSFEKVQLLTHPIWWAEKPESINSIFSRCFQSRSKELDEYKEFLLNVYKKRDNLHKRERNLDF